MRRSALLIAAPLLAGLAGMRSASAAELEHVPFASAHGPSSSLHFGEHSSRPGDSAWSENALGPLTPQFVSVGDRNAVVYYAETKAGYEVVVTFAANAPDDGTSMRSVVTLTPGQQSTLSLGRGAGRPPATLTLRRTGNTLVVVPPQLQAAAAK